jgi:hypothetical protein
MEEVYLYFRTQATIGSDQDSNDSCCFPLSAFAGMRFTSGGGENVASLYFRSMLNNFGYDETADNEVISDYVQIKLKSTTTNREFRKEFFEAIDSAKMKLGSKFFVVADDESTNPTYFSSLVDSVGTISVAAAGAE